MAKPELRVTVFSDYICPFCYIGDARLQQLRDEYELKVNWCLLELHPETPAEGMPVVDLGYPVAQWQRMMAGLRDLAVTDDLPLAEHTFTTNSHQALLLAEAAKTCGREVFYALHQSLFEAFFVAGRNIGDARVLSELAIQAGVDEERLQQAWNQPDYEHRLVQYRRAAQELQVSATPTFFIGRERLDGVVPVARLRQAAGAVHGR